MWAEHESPCVTPESLETDRHIVNALKVKAVGSKSKYKERHLISSLSPATFRPCEGLELVSSSHSARCSGL